MKNIVSNPKKIKIIITIIISIGFGSIQSVFGLVNPAAVYCESLGYELVIEKTIEGEIGICKFPDGTTAEEWAFLQGKSSKDWSYCKKKGYSLKILSDSDKCSTAYSKDCAVCVLKDGTEEEVLNLMIKNKEIPPLEEWEKKEMPAEKDFTLYLLYIGLAIVALALIIGLVYYFRRQKIIKKV